VASSKRCAAALVVGAALPLLFSTGCDGDSAEDDAGPPAVDAGTGPSEGWIVTVQIRGGDEVTSALFVEEIGEPVELDLSGGLALPGRGAAFTSPFEPGVLFASSREAPRLTRYRARPGGPFEEEATVQLAGLAAPPRALGADNYFVVGPRKAYVFDPFAGDFLVLDLQQMTLEGRIALPMDDIPGPNLFPAVGAGAVRRADRLLVPIGFANSIQDVVSPTSLLVVLDTDEDRVEQVLSTEVCGYLRHVWTTDSGDVLLGSDVFTTALEVASDGERGGPTCVIRLGEDLRFADAPVAPPGALTDGTPAGSFVFVSDSSSFVRALDRSALPATPLSRLELNNGAYWRWGFITGIGASPSFRVVEGSALGTGFSATFDVHGRRFAVESRADFSGSTLVELRPDGTLVEGLRTDQLFVGLAPLRFE